MNFKQRVEASRMLKFLKKEEKYIEKMIQIMQQDVMRLKVEEFTLKASARHELLKMDGKRKRRLSNHGPESSNGDEDSLASSRHTKKIRFDIDNSSNSSSLLENEYSQSSQPSPSANDSVISNITDERYLEPLILNPNYFGEAALVEFDD